MRPFSPPRSIGMGSSSIRVLANPSQVSFRGFPPLVRLLESESISAHFVQATTTIYRFRKCTCEQFSVCI